MRWARRGAQVPKERHCRCGRYGCVELLLLLVGPEESLVNSDPVACVRACVRASSRCLPEPRSLSAIRLRSRPHHTTAHQTSSMHARCALCYALCVLCSPSLPLCPATRPPSRGGEHGAPPSNPHHRLYRVPWSEYICAYCTALSCHIIVLLLHALHHYSRVL